MALEEQQRSERAGRIKKLREESPFTQEAVADRVGVKLRTYQKWEEGGGITWVHLESLASLHDVEVQWIHRGEQRTSDPVELRELLDRVLDEQANLLAKLDAVLDEQRRQRQQRKNAPNPKVRGASRLP